MGVTVEELALRISGDSSGGQKAAQDFAEKLKDAVEHPMASLQSLTSEIGESLAASFGTAGAAALVFGGGLAAVAGVAYELSEKAAAVGSNLNDMAMKTGITVPALSRLSQAAQV